MELPQNGEPLLGQGKPNFNKCPETNTNKNPSRLGRWACHFSGPFLSDEKPSGLTIGSEMVVYLCLTFHFYKKNKHTHTLPGVWPFRGSVKWALPHFKKRVSSEVTEVVGLGGTPGDCCGRPWAKKPKRRAKARDRFLPGPNSWHMVCETTFQWLFWGYLPAIGGSWS